MPTSRPGLRGTHGAVSSTHWLASAVGMQMLEEGGNAFDAAVAAAMVLQVVEPHSNGLGGDACIVLFDQRSGVSSVVCGQGPMPAAATIDHFEALGLTQIPGSGLLPASVPGAFGAWLRLLAEFGSMPLRKVMSPAIGYAADGFPVLPDTARAIAELAPLFRSEWKESGRTYLTSTRLAPVAGARLRNPHLANTMRQILVESELPGLSREGGIDRACTAFYQGFVAEGIDAFCRNPALDSTGQRNVGLLRGSDLAAWSATVERPVSLDYRGLTVHKPGPWSQGPVFLQQLALLEGFDLTAIDMDGAEYVHLLTEVAKLAFADREGWYGDYSDSQRVLSELLAPAYTAERRLLIGDRAAEDPAPGCPGGRISQIPSPVPNLAPLGGEPWVTQLQSGMPTVIPASTLRASVKSGDTCTVVVTDRAGNLVSAVPSGGWLKSSPVIPGLGFALGTRGQTMWLTRDHPNSLAPGKRPRTTLSPSVVLRGDRPFLAFGTPGGDRQDQWTLEAFLAVVEFGTGLQRSTEVRAFHTDHFPASFTPRCRRANTLVMEDAPQHTAAKQLEAMGHVVDLVPEQSLATKVCIVEAPDEHGFVTAGAGPRGQQAYAVCR